MKKQVKVDKACRAGRTLADFQQFRLEHPDLPLVQLDSVVGIRGGAVLLTIHFVLPRLQLAFKRSANDSQSVIDIFNRLYWELRPDIFMELFPLLLCDNGSEFSNPSAIEFDAEGNRRSHIFYCDAAAPGQIRRMMSHMNSYKRKELGDKSPYEMFAFLYGEESLKCFGLELIPGDKIILTPALMKL